MPGDEAQPRNAVGIIGRIEPFEDTVETWTSYTERLEQYFGNRKRSAITIGFGVKWSLSKFTRVV
jgi:hypothetical protein